MSARLNGRQIERLTAEAAALADDAAPPPVDPAWAARWAAVEARLDASHEHAADVLESIGLDDDLTEQFARLCETNIDAMYARTYEAERRADWPRALADVLALTPPDLRRALLDHAGDRTSYDGRGTPAARWIDILVADPSALPAGVGESTVRQLLAVLLPNPADGSKRPPVELFYPWPRCQCGLARPVKPRYVWQTWVDEFWSACPHCGASVPVHRSEARTP